LNPTRPFSPTLKLDSPPTKSGEFGKPSTPLGSYDKANVHDVGNQTLSIRYEGDYGPIVEETSSEGTVAYFSSVQQPGIHEHGLIVINDELGVALHSVGQQAKAEYMRAQTQFVAKLNAVARQAQAEFLSECLIHYEHDHNDALEREIVSKSEDLKKEDQDIEEQISTLQSRRREITEELEALHQHEKDLGEIWSGKIDGVKKALNEIKFQDLLSSHL